MPLRIPFKIIFLLIIIFLLCDFKVSNAQDKSPVDVVNLFDRYYGGSDMDVIAGNTTASFRANRPKSVWVVDVWRALKKMEYKRLNSTVIDSRVNKNRKAVVIVEAKIEIASKETIHKEIYYLIQKGEKWFIDDLVVADGEID
jgi:hypothetical protein